MRIFVLVAIMVFCMVSANLCLKTGAVSPGWQPIPSAPALNWRILAGLSFYAVGAVVYILILQTVSLNVAQSFAAVQFVAIILSSHFLLGEDITMVRWVGIAAITAGIALVGWTR